MRRRLVALMAIGMLATGIRREPGPVRPAALPVLRRAVLALLPADPGSPVGASLRAALSPPLAAPTVLERRLAHFTQWIRSPPEREAQIRRQATEIRDRVRAQATADGLVVRSTPSAGSFAKNTGLRRHITGGSEVEGLDVDLPFVVSPQTRGGDRLSELLNRFEGYAARAYPQRPPERSRSKSSIKLAFSGTRLSYDLVPMLADPDDEDYQILLRGDGTRLRTSVRRHIEFVKRRTDASNRTPGPVRFNECVRLLKWWREFRMQGAHSIGGVPTILIDLLAARAFDVRGVRATYAETLRDWFDWLHGALVRRERITFPDYAAGGSADAAEWVVLDPVNPKNNLARGWTAQQVEELAGWLRTSREALQEAIDLDRRGLDGESLHRLVRLFGPPFRKNCGDPPRTP